MRVVFVIPSSESINAAGVRIRYRRLEPFLNQSGVSTLIIPIGDVDMLSLQEDSIIILSKSFTPGAINFLHQCRNLGVPCGIDLFDDYFSDNSLSTFAHLRHWLKLASSISDFLLCSTERMAEVCATFKEGERIHQITDTKDPMPSWRSLEEILETKQNSILNRKQLRVAWFGIGDNPYFDVGIDDLFSHSGSLRNLERHGYSVHLSILTNERALTHKTLGLLSMLPVRFDLKVWNETAERELLVNSDIAFMPVSHQRFSIAKSTNRCLTALSYGCQVLSTGFHLYSNFEGLIYRNSSALSRDLHKSKLRLSRKSIPALQEICDQHYSPKKESEKLIQFLSDKILGHTDKKFDKRICIINFEKDLSFGCLGEPSKLIVINAANLSSSNGANIWIDKLENGYVLMMTSSVCQLIVDNWTSYLTTYDHSGGETVFGISIPAFYDGAAANKASIQRLLSYRFAKGSNLDSNNISKRVIFGFIMADLDRVLTSILGRISLFIHSENPSARMVLCK